jgi:bifunctional UDP-N-acetylglucosamine pyrophosphorylase/glucosamine-1-phosphate N-acetyltransferase
VDVTRVLVIPAAGRGSRLGGTVPKPLAPVNGSPMLDHLVALYRPFVEAFAVIVHPSFAAEAQAWAAGHERIGILEQAVPTGMLDAILVAVPFVRDLRPRMVWITWADQIGILPATLRRLADLDARGAAMIVPTIEAADPYIHFERDAAGRIAGLRQRREGDAMPADGESDMGLFALDLDAFVGELPRYAEAVTAGAATGERNFLPFIPWLAARREVLTIRGSDAMERVGINTPEDLARVGAWLRARPRT